MSQAGTRSQPGASGLSIFGTMACTIKKTVQRQPRRQATCRRRRRSAQLCQQLTAPLAGTACGDRAVGHRGFDCTRPLSSGRRGRAGTVRDASISIQIDTMCQHYDKNSVTLYLQRCRTGRVQVRSQSTTRLDSIAPGSSSLIVISKV